MCFTDSKKLEIMSRHGVTDESDELLKLVAKEWRKLSSTDRCYWDEVARDDKVRFVREKAAYKGPWAVPKRRAKKHPLAPKRPMSAFLKYSQKRRSVVKVRVEAQSLGRFGEPAQANPWTCPMIGQARQSGYEQHGCLSSAWRNVAQC
jgi:hypothetical protein